MKLTGVSVLVTRPAHQVDALAHALEALGAEVVAVPAIEIAPPESYTEFDGALNNLVSYDTVVLTSVNGVAAVTDRMMHLAIPIVRLSSRRLAVIGPATATALTMAIRAPDVMPTEFVSEALADSLGGVAGERILLCRADRARPQLADILRGRGAMVDQVTAYRVVWPMSKISLPDKTPDFITLTSSAGVRGTLDLLHANGRGHWMAESRLVCIGPITAQTVCDLGYEPATVARDYNMPGLVDALLRLAKKEAAHAG